MLLLDQATIVNAMSLEELLERLRNEDETTVLELLEINSEQLVDCFIDVIKEKFKYLVNVYE